MRKTKGKTGIKRAALDLKKLRLLADTTLKQISGGGYYIKNSYWN